MDTHVNEDWLTHCVELIKAERERAASLVEEEIAGLEADSEPSAMIEWIQGIANRIRGGD